MTKKMYEISIGVFRIFFLVAIIGRIQNFLCQLAYTERGYDAVGGEFLVLPVIYLIYILIKSIKETFKDGNDRV